LLLPNRAQLRVVVCQRLQNEERRVAGADLDDLAWLGEAHQRVEHQPHVFNAHVLGVQRLDCLEEGCAVDCPNSWRGWLRRRGGRSGRRGGRLLLLRLRHFQLQLLELAGEQGGLIVVSLHRGSDQLGLEGSHPAGGVVCIEA
jgi:hypothetical protein